MDILLSKTKKAHKELLKLSHDERNKCLENIAVGLKKNEAFIINENKKDIENIPEELRKEINFIPVRNVSEVIENALCKEG